MWWFIAPLIVLGTLLLLFGALVVLGRYKQGALLRPVIARLARIGFMRRFFTKVSTAALERQNPELANAMKKINAVAANPNPQAVQEAPNRQARRRVDRMQQQARAPVARGGRKRKRR